jgi:hemerythrin superfamily protein
MKSTEILDLMVKDHRKIVGLLNDVEKNLNSDLKIMVGVIDKFNWELEKHIFTEEKAIFTSYSPTDITEGYAMVPELIQQHNIIMNKMDVMKKDLMKKRSIDFYEFKELLMEHKNFEEQSLYPKLDQELDESQKKIIINRISEIV